MSMPRPGEYQEIVALIQSTINPLVAKMTILESKVDQLNQDRVTRSDIENLRKEVTGGFVPRDSYEPRHAQLVERDLQLETTIRELRKSYENDIEKLDAKLREETKNRNETLEKLIQARIEYTKDFEKKVNESIEKIQVQKDRAWVRISQWAGILAIILSIVQVILQHTKFN